MDTSFSFRFRPISSGPSPLPHTNHVGIDPKLKEKFDRQWMLLNILLNSPSKDSDTSYDKRNLQRVTDLKNSYNTNSLLCPPELVSSLVALKLRLGITDEASSPPTLKILHPRALYPSST